jgi:hypothetical protein
MTFTLTPSDIVPVPATRGERTIRRRGPHRSPLREVQQTHREHVLALVALLTGLVSVTVAAAAIIAVGL